MIKKILNYLNQEEKEVYKMKYFNVYIKKIIKIYQRGLQISFIKLNTAIRK